MTFSSLQMSKEHEHKDEQQQLPVPFVSNQVPNPLEDKVCMTFANRICENRDLLVVSRKTASHAVFEVGACLITLEATEIHAIEDDPDIRKHVDKVYQLLLDWRFKDRGNGTWARLVECLRSLEDGDLIETIRVYLHKRSSGNAIRPR